VATFRRHLTAVSIAWLLFLATGYAASPLLEYCARPTEAAAQEDACCKGMAPGEMCPMHRHRQPPQDSRTHDQAPARGAMSSTCSPLDSALLSLSFGLGVLASPVSAGVNAVSLSVHVAPVLPFGRTPSLDPPPPRI
jgi:hypothetical protein